MAPRNFDTFDPSSLQQTEDDIINTHFSPASTNNIQQHSPPISTTNNEKVFKPKIVWRNVLIFTYLHVAALYGIYLCGFAKYQTLIFGNNFNFVYCFQSLITHFF